MADVPTERRRFKRLEAPVYCRPLGRALGGSEETQKLKAQDISLGGVRVYTDDKHRPGDRLELELWLPDGESITLDTVVVWVDSLEANQPAKFEVGLKFVDVAEQDLERLQAVLKDV